MYNVFSLINVPTPFFGGKRRPKCHKNGFNIPNIFIFVQNLPERMSFLELLNCHATEESCRLIMA